MAIDAALALEATGERDLAEKAFLLALDPVDLKRESFQALAGAIRLAALYRAAHRDADADRYEAIIARVSAKADSGVRDAVMKLR
jgi:hypothetical protein